MREITKKERPVRVKNWPIGGYQLPSLAPEPDRPKRSGMFWTIIFLLVVAIVVPWLTRPATSKEAGQENPIVEATPASPPLPDQSDETSVKSAPDRAATMESRLSQGQIAPVTEPQADAAVSVPTPVPVPWDKVESFIENNQGAGEAQEAIDVFRTSNPTNREISENVGQLITELLRNTHYENLQNLPRVLRMAQVAEWLLGQTGIEAEFQQRINAETRAAERELGNKLRQPTVVPTAKPTATLPNPTPAGRTVLFAIPPELGLGFSPIGLLQEVEFLLKRKGTTQWKVISVAEYQVGPFVTYDVELQEVGSTNTSWITGMSSCNLTIDQIVDVHSVIKIVLESIKRRFP